MKIPDNILDLIEDTAREWEPVLDDLDTLAGDSCGRECHCPTWSTFSNSDARVILNLIATLLDLIDFLYEQLENEEREDLT